MYSKELEFKLVKNLIDHNKFTPKLFKLLNKIEIERFRENIVIPTDYLEKFEAIIDKYETLSFE